MKDLSLFLTFKMKKGFKNLCTGDASTSTLNQHQPTLEEMIMQLDLEEKSTAAIPIPIPHRMSCVNSSDILRSARNALNQYPRFSLDGKDAMYRSSFRNSNDHSHARFLHLPAKVAGERVIWCKPGVVGKLMGLEAMPVPVRLKHKMMNNSCLVRKQTTKEFQRRLRRYNYKQPVAVDITTDQVGWPMGRFI